MRNILFLLFISLPFSDYAQYVKSDLQRQRIKGSIKTVTEYERDAKTNELVTKSVSKYNNAGNQLDYCTYAADNSLLSKSVYSYDDSGRLTDVKRYRSDGTLNVRTIHRCDARGNVIVDSNYDGSGTLFMVGRSAYNGNGTRRVYDRFSKEGLLFLKSNFKYDSDGNEVEEKQYDSHHGLKYATTYEYEQFDAHGNWTKRIMFKNDEPAVVVDREFEAK